MGQGAGIQAAAGDHEVQASPIGPERDRLLGQLTGGVAHDFNNMLATVLGCLELMERRAGDPDRLRTLVQRATDAVERAAELTSSLVQFARRPPEPPRVLAVNDVVTRLLPLITSALGRRVRLDVQLAPSLPAVNADLTALEAAVLALCLAARRTLPSGGQMRLATAISAPAGGSIALSVTAEGEGRTACELALVEPAARSAGGRLETGAPGGALELRLLLMAREVRRATPAA